MVFWLVLGLMTAAAIAVVVRPLLRRAPSPAADADGDLAVYRDQLAEIECDLSRGVLAPPEAEAARIEISRRLLAAAERADAARQTGATAAPRSGRAVSVAALIALPVGAVALYGALGSPRLPGQPLAERRANASANGGAAANEPNSLAALVNQVETHLRRNPDDGRGWEVLAPAFMQLERFDDAVKARRNAIRLLGATPTRIAGLGEALAAAAGGMVTPEARAEFERALKIDPDNVTAALYIGLAAQQAGQPEEARRIWEGMIARAPDGAPWVAFVRQAIASLGAPGSGPPTGDARAASDASADLTAEQIETARGMVERLAARLATDGSDVDGWLRLVRSYMVLGEPDKARAAASDARRALADDANKLQRLDSGVKALGVEG
ncbi:MAG: c-type cytochrome biogenesis protein CcmI [Xanthobacteraceae bacterium]